MNFEKVANQIDPSWHRVLKPLIESPMFDEIILRVKESKQAGKQVTPLPENMLRAFKETKYEDLRVVILGQDPYFSMKQGKFIADGLALSCSITGELQPSLESFYKGMEEDLADGMDLFMDKNPDLSYLAKQGVLLLNCALTVEVGEPGSHNDIWSLFTKRLIEKLNELNTGIVFMLLGKTAASFEQEVAPFSHWTVKCPHPANASYTGGIWEHNKIFTQVNQILKKTNNVEIQWYNKLPQ